MRKRLIAILSIAMTLAVTGTAQDSSEETKTRPNRQEIIDLMVKTAKMPAQQQSAKIDSLWQASSGSPTPRSDFMFCTGLAYLGNYKAQRCVGSAYENGRGVVEDLSEAYAWYAVALDNKAADKPARETIEADKERVKGRLISAYPHPTEDELDDLAKGQKSRIEQYQEDLKSAKK